jgi:hypothetical protein
MIEQCITIAILARRLAMSPEKARRIVMSEPGVLKFEGRRKAMYRIPESVAERIVRRATTLPVTQQKVTN